MEYALFVVSPHPDYFHDMVIIEDLVDEAMLVINPSRISTGKIANQLLKWWCGLIRIRLEDLQQGLNFRLQSTTGNFFGIFLGMASIN